MRHQPCAFGCVRQSLVGQGPLAHGAAGFTCSCMLNFCSSVRPHLPLLQAWQAAGGSIDWCRDLGVDGRSMRFARDIRQQLERIIGPDGSGFDGGSGRQRPERQRGSEGGEAGGSGEAARRDEQPAAEGRQWEGERERDSSKRDRERGDRERHYDSRGGKRPRRSGGFSDAATVSALRMALTIGALWLQGTCTGTGLAQIPCNWSLCAPHGHNTVLKLRLPRLQGLPTGWRGACPCTTATAHWESRPPWRR